MKYKLTKEHGKCMVYDLQPGDTFIFLCVFPMNNEIIPNKVYVLGELNRNDLNIRKAMDLSSGKIIDVGNAQIMQVEPKYPITFAPVVLV